MGVEAKAEIQGMDVSADIGSPKKDEGKGCNMFTLLTDISNGLLAVPFIWWAFWILFLDRKEADTPFLVKFLIVGIILILSLATCCVRSRIFQIFMKSLVLATVALVTGHILYSLKKADIWDKGQGGNAVTDNVP